LGGKKNDYFAMQGILTGLPQNFNPTTHGFTLRVSNANGTIYQGSLLPGDLTPNANGTKFSFRDKSALAGPGFRDGIYQVKLKNRGDDWRFKIMATGDLSSATLPEMTVQITLNGFMFETTNIWTQYPTGWKLSFNQ
jgi:hypothetical protein